MKISEVKSIIETMECLGFKDAELVIDDSRDGNSSFPKATVKPIRITDQREETIFLAVSYSL